MVSMNFFKGSGRHGKFTKELQRNGYGIEALFEN